MSKIDEMMQKDFWDADIPDHPAQAWEQGYKTGARAVLREIEMANSLGSSPHVSFARIMDRIRQLKGGDK